MMLSKIRTEWLQLTAVVALSGLLTACTSQANPQNTSSSPSLSAIDYTKKLETVQKVQDDWTPLSLMTTKLATDWPKLFALSGENQLFQTYATITWHVRPVDQERLQANLAQHSEYKQYQELYRLGLLPAKSCQVQSLNATWNEIDKSYKLDATYHLVLQDNSVRDIPVSLLVKSNQTEFINEKFNTATVEEPAPTPKNKQEASYQQFIFSSLSPNEIRKLTPEQIDQLLQQ